MRFVSTNQICTLLIELRWVDVLFPSQTFEPLLVLGILHDCVVYSTYVRIQGQTSKSVYVCCRQEIGAKAIEMHGTLEKQLEDLKTYQESIISYTPEINTLESIHQEIQEALIFDNPYTSYTMEVTNMGIITLFNNKSQFDL